MGSHGTSWVQSLRGNTVTCHFYLFLLPLFDLCSTSRYFHYFHLQSSIFWSSTSSYDLPNTHCLLSSVPHLHFNSSFAYFHLLSSTSMFLCSILLLYFHHLSITPCLPFPTLTTQHSISCDSVGHLFTFSILYCSPYYLKSCSIKFLPIYTYFPSLELLFTFAKIQPTSVSSACLN